MKRFHTILGFSSLFLLSASVVSAAVMTKDGTASFNLPIEDDVYTAGNAVTITQDVRGDVFAAGSDVTIQKTVTQDVTAAGKSVYLNGNIGDDARVAGDTVVIAGNVHGDVIAAGNNVTIEKGASIDGDFIGFGKNITVRGKVGGNVKLRATSVRLDESIGGTLTAYAEDITVNGAVTGTAALASNMMIIGSTASFLGPVHYWSDDKNVSFGNSVKNGEAMYDQNLASNETQEYERDTGFAASVAGAFSMFAILSAALVIALLAFATRTYFVDAAAHLTHEPGWSLLYGLLYFILMPILAILLFVTIIGIPLGLLILCLYVFSFVFAVPLSAMVFAKWAQAHYHQHWNTWMFILVSVLCFIALRLIGIIPVAGPIVKVILVLIAFGSIMTTKYQKYRAIA